MKNKAYQFTIMSEEDRSMHLFYSIEGMVESLQEIGKELDTESLNGASRLALLTDIFDQIENLYSRVHKDYVEKQTKEAINYAI
jgi:hypothetical protein